MTAAERGVLLLCASLDSADRPLTMAQFRELSLRAQAMGRPEGDLSAELTQKDAERLGYEPEEAARIVSLLSRERALERYLAEAEKHGVVPLTRITAAYPPQLAEKFGVSCPPVLFARGMKHLLDRVPLADATVIKRQMIAYFGKTIYYRCCNKERLIKPKEQEYIQGLFRRRGVTETPQFDEYIEYYDLG
mgnify:CR=1 FL=1